MTPPLLPILDNHMHLNPAGRCLDAVREFARAGGTHIVLVSLPPWSLGIDINAPDDYRNVFDKILRIARRAEECENVKIFVVLGVHPAELTKYYGRFGLARSVEIMLGGLEIAHDYVVEGKAIGLKSGRPHYPVEPKIWEASNDIMRRSFELAKGAGCAIQLHTESATEEGLAEIAGIARNAGLPDGKVVKHFSPPIVKICEKYGIFPSVLSGEDAIQKALAQGTRFMMETDYIDDLGRPGSVLGPKTVPKRTKQLIPEWGEDVFWKIHKENPEKVYGVEITI
ncbi:MAG: TatD family hydrolase [Candidatus Methanoperedens sp.]|nr:TatD family hydrolase [Candidatus Methanoperedens sp.]MCE8424686.1 TatD family hydrolase [Candidatus Methanoperedens sp.]MCE8427124.1 TatD family hydrolase [Candidatus Methanoperedens sp.]